MGIYLESVYDNVVEKDPDQKIFHQAVYEVLHSLEPAIKKFPKYKDNKILYGLGKVANAGGVATSGLEMAQNSRGTSGAGKRSTLSCTRSW